jgi:hypothetical protein
MSADHDRPGGDVPTLAENLRGVAAPAPSAPETPRAQAPVEAPALPRPSNPLPREPSGKKKQVRPRGTGRNTNTERSRANQKVKDQERSEERAWLRTLRALDLLVVYGPETAVDLLRLEIKNLRWARDAVERAGRYMAEQRYDVPKAEARAQYKARLVYLFHRSLEKEDLRNARQVARDMALEAGVIIDEELAPSTAVGSGLDVSDLTLEEQIQLRDLLQGARERRGREGR